MRLPVLPASLLCSLALVAPAHATVGAGDLDALVDRSLDGLFTLHLPSGGYDDPLAGPRFNYGAIGLAWLTGERAPAGPEGDARRAAAATTFRTGARTARPGAFQIWLEALALTEPSGAWLDAETRAALSAHLAAFADPAVGPRAQPCHDRPECYNNLKLVNAIASLQLTRTGLTSPSAHARLTDPAATEAAARAFLALRVPGAQRPELRLRAGDISVAHAAVLSDPSRNPLAYHALSTAMLVRGLRLLGRDAPVTARRAARRALWALVALADPHGTVAWMGRGQENTWTYAASTYAALAGAAEFATEPALAKRLRRLAELTFAELGARATTFGLAVLSGPPRATLAGADRSQDTIACNGLALSFLALAAAEAAAAAGPTAPLPSQTPGATVVDPVAAGVAAVRGVRTWFAVHRTATHPQDARYDAGLLAAQVQEVDGRWRSIVGQRPNTAESERAPSAGPLLLRRGRLLSPSGALSARPGAITLRGAWRRGSEAVPASWAFRATARGVALDSPCPRGTSVRLVEWIGAEADHEVERDGLVLEDRAVHFSIPVAARELATVRASAAYERLKGVQLDARCDGRPLRVQWTG